MSAAATAAGYLYASGRLRGRSKDEEPGKHDAAPPARRKRIRVAALPERPAAAAEAYPAAPQPAARTRPAPRIEYRVRRWRPDAE